MLTLQNAALVAVTAIVTMVAPSLFTLRKTTPPAAGSCNEDFKDVETIFRQNLETGRDLGGAFAVYHKGAVVCDLWGGWADVGAERAWDKDTITILFSATKGLAALCIALLRDRNGKLYPLLSEELRCGDNVREWTGLQFGKFQRAAENRGNWRKLVLKSSVVPQRPSWLRD